MSTPGFAASSRIFDPNEDAPTEAHLAGPAIPAELGFVPRLDELFTLLGHYYSIVLEDQWTFCFHGCTWSGRWDAEARMAHLIRAIKRLPSVMSDDPAAHEVAADSPRTTENVDEQLRETFERIEEEFFEHLDPRFVRVFNGDATPEQVMHVHEESKRGRSGGLPVIQHPDSALRPMDDNPNPPARTFPSSCGGWRRSRD